MRAAARAQQFQRATGATLSRAALAPALFIGHGSPMLAIEPSAYSDAWAELGRRLPPPRSILCISAHWYVPETAVTAMQWPPTIHDFYGFPPALYAMQYPAPGSPELAARVAALLGPHPVQQSTEWGLDHGAWSVLRYLYPEGRIPVVQLSINAALTPPEHYRLAARLAPLRDEAVLVLGSGNVVHNLRARQARPDAPAPPWALQFNAWVTQAIRAGDHAALLDYGRAGPSAELSVPTPEHYLPLLYVLALQRSAEPAEIVLDGIELGCLSMLSVAVGA